MNASMNKILGGALAAQVVLGAVMWWPRGDTTVAATPLLDVASADVTAIEVTGRVTDGKVPDPVRLERRGPDGWVISSAWDYPADPKKVTDALDALTAVKVRSPIATNKTSHAQLKVGDAEYGRKVKVTAGDKTFDLVIGAAASKSVNVRKATEDAVYVGNGMSEWTLGDRPRSYWDTSIVDADVALVDAFSVSGPSGALALTKGAEGAWTAVGLTEPVALDTKKVEDLLRKAVKLRMTEVMAGSAAPEHGLTGGHVVTFQSAGGEATTYTVGADLESAYAALQVDGKPWVYKIAKSTAAAIRDASVTSLTAAP